MDQWSAEVYVQEMIENGFIDPEDDVLIQETTEQFLSMEEFSEDW